MSNAQCLSEGVDVPSLDGVVFFEPRKSVIDVVQAVGRVMRKQDDKDFGYVVIPLVTKHDSLDELEAKSYKTLVEVVNALRAHDDRIDRLYNQLTVQRESESTDRDPIEVELPPPLADSYEYLKPTIMKNVGGLYFEDYGVRLGEVAADIKIKMQSRYDDIIETLHENLQGVVGDTVTKQDTLDTLAQHCTIKPVFGALFPSFDNIVARAFDDTVVQLDFSEELLPLERYYEEMEFQIANIKNDAMKQSIIKKIYDNFFRGFDKATQTKHGIVYTPIEVVDYVIHSVSYLLHKEFGIGFEDESVTVLDPFAGTGVFLARLLQQYKTDPTHLHMNELMLLAYYIGTVNVESIIGKSFNNSLLVDTFTIAEGRRDVRDFTTKEFEKMNSGVVKQQETDIMVIMTNPPWNVNNKVSHKYIETRINKTFSQYYDQIRTLKNSFVKAIRFASDRIGESGVIGFVIPATWLKGNTEVGVRACLYKEFTDVYVFDMRGNQQGTKGDESRCEGGKIFGGGSRQPTCMLFLIKNPRKEGCTIHYHDIGDYLSRDNKLSKVRELKSLEGTELEPITPNSQHDWLDQRDTQARKDYYNHCIPMGIRKGTKQEVSIFEEFSLGVTTMRDAWVYNVSEDDLVSNMKRTIKHCTSIDLNNPNKDQKYVHWGNEKDSSIKNWLVRNNPNKPQFDKTLIRTSLYRPFLKHFLYLDDTECCFVARPRKIPDFYPLGKVSHTHTHTHTHTAFWSPTKQQHGASSSRAAHQTSKSLQTGRCFPNEHSSTRQDDGIHGIHNQSTTRLGGRTSCTSISIIVPDKIRNEWSSAITNIPADLHIHQASQVFPFQYRGGETMKDNITDAALRLFREIYKDDNISKTDIFYYTYGILHSEGYRAKYKDFLVRDLPRIPFAPDFKAFRIAGEALADLHLNFETVPRHDLGEPLEQIPDHPYSMSFGTKKENYDRKKFYVNKTLIYDNLPIVQYEVNGLPPHGWLTISLKKHPHIERYPYRYYTGTQIRESLERLLYVGRQSDKIIKELPKEFEMPVTIRRDTLDVWG